MRVSVRVRVSAAFVAGSMLALAPAAAKAAAAKYPWNIPDNVRVAQKTNDDGVRTFLKIQDAIDSISGATDTNRFVVKVMPGTYLESLTMKAFVDIVGSGPEDTVIEDSGSAAAILADTGNFSVRDLTIVQHGDSGVRVIGANRDNITLRNIVIKMRAANGSSYGIFQDSGKLELHDSRIEWNGCGSGCGAEAIYVDTVLVSKSVVDMSSDADFEGIVATNPTIRDSVISLTARNSGYAVMVNGNGGIGNIVNTDITVRATGIDGGNYGVSAYGATAKIQSSRIEVTTAGVPVRSAALGGDNFVVDGSVLSGAAYGLSIVSGSGAEFRNYTVNNSSISGGVLAVSRSGGVSGENRFRIGNSKLSGGHDLLPGSDKVVNCYDINYDPLPNL
jgi:hypothetical protein